MPATKLTKGKYPLTAKPSIDPKDIRLYEDIFSLQNTLRSMMQLIDINSEYFQTELDKRLLEAPKDGKIYGRKNGAWVEVTSDPNYASVALLLHFDGTVGATTFTDNSPSPKTVTGNSNSKLAALAGAFGGSALQNASGGVTLVNDSTSFDFGSGNFTIEFDYWPTNAAPGSTEMLINKANGTNNPYPWQIYRLTGNVLVARSYNASAVVQWQIDGARTLTVNARNHIALVRSGTTITLYVNGFADGTATFSGALPVTTDAISIGGYSGATSSAVGYFDEVRLTKGVARYTANFTPSATAFPNS